MRRATGKGSVTARSRSADRSGATNEHGRNPIPMRRGWRPIRQGKLTFGEHKGSKLGRVPDSYLVWMMGKRIATKAVKGEQARRRQQQQMEGLT